LKVLWEGTGEARRRYGKNRFCTVLGRLFLTQLTSFLCQPRNKYMRKSLLKLLVAGFLFFTTGLAQAQLDNRAFQYRTPVRPEYDNQLRLAVQGFLFSKDDEYFNKIFEGRTYYGTQLATRLAYFPSPKLRLEAGIYLWKDYGNPRLMQVQPLFTAIYQTGPHRILLGNIEGHLNHNYIEPLFDFERVMLNRLEEGMQYQYTTRRWAIDAQRLAGAGAVPVSGHPPGRAARYHRRAADHAVQRGQRAAGAQGSGPQVPAQLVRRRVRSVLQRLFLY
jgi:hypothetical protein